MPVQDSVIVGSSSSLSLEGHGESVYSFIQGISGAIGSDDNANVTPPMSSTPRIPQVPTNIKCDKNNDNYLEYYVPKVVSIGPYHYWKPEFQVVEKLKAVFTLKLFSDKKEALGSLYSKLFEMTSELRGFYEEGSKATSLPDEDFTMMMLMDSCFILYYILYIYEGTPANYPEFKGDEIIYIHRDLFLMENQIPFKVLKEVMELLHIGDYKIKRFVYGTIFSSTKPLKLLKLLQSIFSIYRAVQRTYMERRDHFDPPDHLLHLLHRIVTAKVKVPTNVLTPQNNYMCNFGTANELVDIGIQFKPSDIWSLACVKFANGCLELPPITVDDSTKAKWLNLMVFEKGSCSIYNSWVALYVCFLHSLIEQPEDVKVLRKAWVLGNYTGRSKDVVKLFDEIATGLVPNNLAYLEVKNKIQIHYESWRSTLLSQLRHEYIKSPWSFLALVGALIALFLTAVQTYFTVWSPKGECDDLCKSLKMNHHL